MPRYETPGAYWEGRDATPAIDAARMDVAGFVGIALKGPLDTAVPVESARQFEAHFGGFTGGGYLAYAIKAYFDNGGRRAWVVRVATADCATSAAPAGLEVALPAMALFPDWPGSWLIQASSPGQWGNAVDVSIRPGRRVVASSLPAGGTAESLAVASTAGFTRDSLVRISQSGRPPAVRVLARVDAAARQLYLVNPEPRLRRVFETPLAGFDPTRTLLIESLSFSVVVREAGLAVGLATDLSLVPGHPRYAPDVLASPDYAGALLRATPPAAPFPIVVIPAETTTQAAIPLKPATGSPIPLTGGRDGLVDLGVTDFIGDPFPPEASLTATRRGLQVFERVAEPAVLAIPDVLIRPEQPPDIELPPRVPPDPCAACPADAEPSPLQSRPTSELPPIFSDDQIFQVQQALVQHCETRRDCMALIDPSFTAISSASLGIGPVQAWRARFDSRCAAMYAPWVLASDPLVPGELRAIPACGHVAGQFALVTLQTGVHRAPANIDLAWSEATTLSVDDTDHGVLNTLGINVIRPALGRALRVLGARTMSSDPVARFVPVRRLVMMLLRTFDRTTQWAVFEPNDHRTRSNLVAGFGNFLQQLWTIGALAGPSPDTAYSVRCDDSNNPPAARDNGRLVCDIAIAPVNPFEFVVLRIGRVDGELEVQEQSVSLQEALS